MKTKRIRNGITQVWVMRPGHGGSWVSVFPQWQPRERCRTCHDTGQVIAGVADPDDPWSATTYEDCPQGCRRTTT